MSSFIHLNLSFIRVDFFFFAFCFLFFIIIIIVIIIKCRLYTAARKMEEMRSNQMMITLNFFLFYSNYES